MWFNKKDKTRPVITAKEQSSSPHGKNEEFTLPKTAILLYMSGLEYIKEHYEIELITERFPRFLNACPVYKICKKNEVCFLDGGRGAPQAVDTIETLKALGVENVVTVGMIGGYSKLIKVGDIVIPPLVYSEEGSSLHYYEKTDYFKPNLEMYNKAICFIKDCKQYPIVSTDAVYRQTFYKESLWRDKGAVGVDMETSAVFSVAQYLGIKAVALLMVSDIHPVKPDAPKWEWHMTKDMKYHLAEQGIALAKKLIK